MSAPGSDWRELAFSNKARLDGLEPEVQRMRERLHAIESEIAAVAYLGRQVAEVAGELHDLGEKIERVSRRAIERPSAGGWSALAGWAAVLVALLALVVAALR